LHTDRPIRFDSFRLDPLDARVFRENLPISLTPKSFAVLNFLLQSAGRLVTKEELIRHVWDDVCVSDASLKVCVREVRQALGDEAQSPRYIETVHRRGYRFIGKVIEESLLAADSIQPRVPALSGNEVVGRQEELAQLNSLLAAAMRGERQVAFLTGDPGSGKTALVSEFARMASAAGAWVATGQCFEQFGTGEAFLPVLEAVSRHARGPHAERLIPLLANRAPTWLVQLP
jgi:DNA-binding winged helix-turn-helix (wHTH) protein